MLTIGDESEWNQNERTYEKRGDGSVDRWVHTRGMDKRRHRGKGDRNGFELDRASRLVRFDTEMNGTLLKDSSIKALLQNMKWILSQQKGKEILFHFWPFLFTHRS